MPLKIYKRKDREHYLIRGTVGGQRVEESAGTADKKIAEQKRAKREAELHRASIFGPESVATWGRAVNLFLDGGGDGRFLPRLFDHFDGMRLVDINQETIDRAARILYPKAKPQTRVRQVYAPVIAVLRKAAKSKLCPMPMIERPKVPTLPPRTYATPEWIEAFAHHANPELGALAVLMAYTGARISEALRVTWEDVDLPGATVVFTRTKTGIARRVKLAARPVAALANLGEEKRGRVFSYAGKDSVYQAWRTACRRAGIPYISPHGAGRHAFASWLLAEGYTLHDVAKLGGWADIKMVADIYGHLEQSRLDRATEELGTGWGGTKSGKAIHE